MRQPPCPRRPTHLHPSVSTHPADRHKTRQRTCRRAHQRLLPQPPPAPRSHPPSFFFLTDPPPPETYPLPLHDPLPTYGVSARRLAERARAVYALGAAHPGVCQTAPARAPYFYEEDDWADDMELGAAELYALTREPSYLGAALQYAALEPVSPWMGQDTARHYQWYPWHNNGHYEIWRATRGPRGPGGPDSAQRRVAEYYARGLGAVARRARNGFRIGIPFIWCSNNLLASFATQAHFYRRMTGDSSYPEYRTAAPDWVFGPHPRGGALGLRPGGPHPPPPPPSCPPP